MQKMSAGRGKTIQKILNAVFLSPKANKAWTAAAAGTAGYMVGSDVLNETIAPAVKKDVQPHIDYLTDTLVRGGNHLNEIAHAGEKAIRDSRLQDTVTDAKNIMLDNLAAGTQQALVASLAAGGGAAGGYGVATLLSENPNYRMPAALLGAAIGGTAGMLYPKLIKSSNSQLTGAYTMTDNTAADLFKDAGIKDWAKGALSVLKRIRTPKTTAIGRFTGNIKPWTQKATSKLPPGTGLAVGGAVTAGALGRNMINNYYDAQAAAELQRQRDMDVHRAVLIGTQAQNAARQALTKSTTESPVAQTQPNWAGLGIGAGAGGLAGYGLGAALSKDKLVRLLTALGGGALGGYVGNQIANQNAKQASLAMPTAERIMCKIASRDGSGLYTLASFAAMRKTAAGEQVPTVWDKIQEWATADNYKNLKRVGTGLGVGLGTYALSGLLPGARKERGARALLAGAAGLGAGLYGDKLVNGIQSYFNRSTAPTRKQKQEQATTTKATTQQAAQPANPQQVRIPTYQDFIQRMINRRMVSGPQLLPVQNADLQQPNYGPRVR